MERNSWWRMEQVPQPLSRALCAAFCSILLHNFRSMSHPPNRCEVNTFVSKVFKIIANNNRTIPRREATDFIELTVYSAPLPWWEAIFLGIKEKQRNQIKVLMILGQHINKIF